MLAHPIFYNIYNDWYKWVRGVRNIEHKMLSLHWEKIHDKKPTRDITEIYVSTFVIKKIVIEK